MARRRGWVWVLVCVLVGLALAGAAMLMQAVRTPPAYQPVQLEPPQRQDVAERFYNHLADVHNKATGIEPFEVAVSAAEINAYLASMDEIGAMLPGKQAGQVGRAMQRAGLESPAVVLHDGAATLMVHSSQYDKVLSAKLAVAALEDGRLSVQLRQVRVGRLPVPRTMIRGLLAKAARRIAPMAKAPDGEGPDVARMAQRTGAVLAGLVTAALRDEPMDGRFKADGRSWQVSDVRIGTSGLVVRFVPATGQ